jgi:transmembrane sensor
MQNKDILDLIHDERFCNYCLNANAEDVRYWENWLADHPAERSAVEKQKTIVVILAYETAAQVTDHEYKKLQQKIKKSNKGRPVYFIQIVRWSVAATILLTTGLGYYYYQKTQHIQETVSIVAPKILSIHDRATLTLANGQMILLSDAKPGKLAVESGITVSSNSQGQIVYAVSEVNKPVSGAIGENTLSTAVGGQYQVILPDSTHVWLNALSTLRYPARFTGNKRQVYLTGEGYFEVTHNKKMPFYVSCPQQRIAVIGTHFNVRCYGNDPETRTTLLKGKVLVSAGADSAQLSPGQTLTVQQKEKVKSPMLVTNDPDPESSIAWKNGMFHFHKANIEEIIRVFSRWYNVDIIYRGKPNNRLFSGDIPKDQPLSAALNILRHKGIQIKTEGKKIIIEENGGSFTKNK